MHDGRERAPDAELTRAMLAAALDCVIAMDAAGTIVEFNPAAERTFGITAADALGREMAELIVPPALREAHRAGLRRYLADGEPHVLGRRIEIDAQRADGTVFPVELTISRTSGEGDPVFVGYLRDITERLQADRELRDSRVRIVEAGFEARRRIERDLHDGAQQHLVSLALTLRLARSRCEEHHDEAADLLDEAIRDLATASAELRELARGIHPAVLSEGGLRPALEGLARRATVPVDLQGIPDERLPDTVESTVYFTVAEALVNVDRSAEAQRAVVEVHRREDVLVAVVRDDGRGGADPEAGSGLGGLMDRAAAVGGTLEVVSPPGEGTTVRLEVPCAS